MSPALEKILQNARLISLPDTYLRLREVVNDPGYCMGDVADVIINDPAMTARLLRLVNSAYFGLAAKIDAVDRAVSLLGTEQVHDLVLATAVSQTFSGMSNQVMNMETFWRNSVRCAIACRELAFMCNVLDGDRVFVAGLLHDIGHLVMYQSVPDEAQQAISEATKRGLPVFKVERALLNTDFAKVGGTLMRRWNLPRSLWEPAEFHIEPTLAEEFPLFASLLHIGSRLAAAMEDEQASDNWVQTVDPYAWRSTGLTPERCAPIPGDVNDQFAAVLNLLFPQPKRAVG